MNLSHKTLNRLLAILVFLVTFFSYVPIMGVTISFWDCGEYAAAGPSLGVPHPPGNPFYIMIARVFTVMFPFVKDVGHRMNYIVVLCGSAIAMLIYLSIVRVFSMVLGGDLDTKPKRISAYVGGIVGAFFAIFANTVMFCTVENEVNTPLLLPIMLVIWLALVWSQSNNPKRDRYLILISYLSFLGIGIHMMSMIVIFPVFLFIVLMDRSKLTDLRLWACAIVNGLVIYQTSFFIVASIITALFTLLMVFVDSNPVTKKKWNFCFWMVFYAILGFSVHTYLPIRSTLNPMIDENHPVTWSTFKGYLDRTQYGSESMFTRMFYRRATWSHQFGIEGHMGFGGFLITQFFNFSPLDTQQSLFKTHGSARGFLYLLIYMIPLGLMFFGWQYVYKRHKNVAILMISFTVVFTVLWVLAMNFGDGLKPERYEYEYWVRSGKQGPMPQGQREVRVRDYFYVVGFMAYGIWMGIAAGGLLYGLYMNRRRYLRTTVAPAMTVLLVASPVLPYTQNIKEHDRSQDYLPFDFAYNLLMSCDKDAVLFTNGDNDTFPVWALQEAYGIRKDIRLVNLSLVNTDWYIKQLKKLVPQVPISFTEEQISLLAPERNPFEKPTVYELPTAKLTVMLPDQKERPVLHVQDKMVLNIVDANQWKKPIYFSSTVASENYMGLGPYMIQEGLVSRLMPEVVPPQKRIDVEKSIYMLEKVYKYRGLNAPQLRFDENKQSILINYAASYMQIAMAERDTLQSLKMAVDALKSKPDSASTGATELKAQYQQRLERLLAQLRRCVDIIPWDWRPRMLLQEFLVNHDRFDEAEKLAKASVETEPDNLEYLKMLAQVYSQNNKLSESNKIMKKVIEKEPEQVYNYVLLSKNYEDLKQYDSAISVIKQYKLLYPADNRVDAIVDRLNMEKSPPPMQIAPEKAPGDTKKIVSKTVTKEKKK